MPTYESTIVRRLIEEHEPIKDVDLNFRLVAEGIDPHDAIVLEDILEEQGRIEYDPESRCFETITTSA
jgi:hypothetical protein